MRLALGIPLKHEDIEAATIDGAVLRLRRFCLPILCPSENARRATLLKMLPNFAE